MDNKQANNEDACAFLLSFANNRRINREFYHRISENRFDYRMVDTTSRKSDSPRESLAHQINVQHAYMMAAQTGELQFGLSYDHTLKTKSKETLLRLLDEADIKLTEILADHSIAQRQVVVPWSPKKVSALTMLWGLNNHEILHTGWNLAIMDHLNIERFSEMKAMWG